MMCACSDDRRGAKRMRKVVSRLKEGVIAEEERRKEKEREGGMGEKRQGENNCLTPCLIVYSRLTCMPMINSSQVLGVHDDCGQGHSSITISLKNKQVRSTTCQQTAHRHL